MKTVNSKKENSRTPGTPTAAKAWQRAGSTAVPKQHKDHGRLQQQGTCNSRHVLLKEGKPVTTMTPATTVTRQTTAMMPATAVTQKEERKPAAANAFCEDSQNNL